MQTERIGAMTKRKALGFAFHSRSHQERISFGIGSNTLNPSLWSDRGYWKKESQYAAGLENIVFSYPLEHKSRKAEGRHRRAVRSSVKTKWARYLRLSGD